MKAVYKVDDMEFSDKKKAEKYEAIIKDSYEEIEIVRVEKEKVIPVDKLKELFDLGQIDSLYFYIKDESGVIKEDGGYETNCLDDTGHLDCTDEHHGLLEWSEKDQSYYRILFGRSWKVELLGIKKVYYY